MTFLESSSRSTLLVEHDLFRKPVSNFRDHALAEHRDAMPTDSTARIIQLPTEPYPEVTFYIPATGPSARPRRILKSGDTFLVVDSHGDIGVSSGGPDGLFHADTRFLSQLGVLLNGMPLLLLGSNLRDDN